MPVLGEVFLSLVPLHPKWSESAATLEDMFLVTYAPITAFSGRRFHSHSSQNRSTLFAAWDIVITS